MRDPQAMPWYRLHVLDCEDAAETLESSPA